MDEETEFPGPGSPGNKKQSWDVNLGLPASETSGLHLGGKMISSVSPGLPASPSSWLRGRLARLQNWPQSFENHILKDAWRRAAGRLCSALTKFSGRLMTPHEPSCSLAAS